VFAKEKACELGSRQENHGEIVTGNNISSKSNKTA
jgi:hypothetical protein